MLCYQVCNAACNFQLMVIGPTGESGVPVMRAVVEERGAATENASKWTTTTAVVTIVGAEIARGRIATHTAARVSIVGQVWPNG
jgi:hypothetical protein